METVKKLLFKWSWKKLLAIVISITFAFTVNVAFENNRYIKEIYEKDDIALVIMEIDRYGNLLSIRSITQASADSLVIDMEDTISIPIWPGKKIEFYAPTKRERDARR